jgi:hypothetical protein
LNDNNKNEIIVDETITSLVTQNHWDKLPFMVNNLNRFLENQMPLTIQVQPKLTILINGHNLEPSPEPEFGGSKVKSAPGRVNNYSMFMNMGNQLKPLLGSSQPMSPPFNTLNSDAFDDFPALIENQPDESPRNDSTKMSYADKVKLADQMFIPKNLRPMTQSTMTIIARPKTGLQLHRESIKQTKFNGQNSSATYIAQSAMNASDISYGSIKIIKSPIKPKKIKTYNQN